jgi:TonB family protein
MRSSKKRILAAGSFATAVLIAFMSCAWASDSTAATALDAQEARYARLQKFTRDLPLLTDWRGKTMRDDMRERVLTPSAQAEIERLRSLAHSQIKSGETHAADSTVSSLADTLNGEIRTFQAIAAYWNSGAKNNLDRSTYLEYLSRNGVEPRRAEEIKAVQQKLAEQLAAAQFDEATNQTYPALQKVLATAQQEENDAIAQKIGTAGFVPFLEQKRSGRCPKPVAATSGNSKPKMGPTPSGKEYYPAPSKRLQEEGLVYVMVQVSAKGCAERAVVTTSSGYTRLDNATLDMMMDASYLPAEHNGQAIPATLFTKMVWELKGP